jgi:glycosyltransferase involved in cell wall biosynthesis
MRILHIPHAYAPVHGGTELLIQRIGERIAELGHLVRVLTTDLSDVEGFFKLGVPKVTPRRETIGGISVHRLAYGSFDYRYGAQLFPKLPSAWAGSRLEHYVKVGIHRRLTLRIALEVAWWRPDVVVALPHLLPPVLSVLRARRLRSFPLTLVPLLHPDWPPDHAARMRQALLTSDSVVAVTPSEVDEMTHRYGIPSDKIFLAGMGVDIADRAGPALRPPDVLYLGRKSPSKRIGDLIDAMQMVWCSHPEARLILAGSRVHGTDEIDRQLAQLPVSCQERVVSVDNVSTDEKSRLLSNVRCLVLPSHSESFGIVLLEAMAHGTPVVAPDLPVFQSVVSKGVEGLLVGPSDPASLANGIRQLLGNAEKARAMGRAGRARVEREHRWDMVAERYLAAYRFARDSWRRSASEVSSRRTVS